MKKKTSLFVLLTKYYGDGEVYEGELDGDMTFTGR
jgi:hypothetical protein